jgi:hypothetical protein
MSHLCCSSCCVRLAPAESGRSTCPSCGRPLTLTSARGAVGYRLLEIVDAPPLSPTAAAVAAALDALRPPVN